LLKWQLRSPLGLLLARALLAGRPQKPHHRISADFFMETARRSYTSRTAPVVWSNLFMPSELFWALGVTPFFPETWTGLAASMGLSSVGLTQSAAIGYPIDLCTVHRSGAGLHQAGLFPRADAYVSTSNTCDVAGQVLANLAHTESRPFFFLDVPQSDDEAAVDYVAAQLRDLVEQWTATLGVTYDPDRLRQTIRLSNQARTLALEVERLREAEPTPLRGSGMLDQLAMLTSMFGHPAGVTYYQALRDYAKSRLGDPEQPNQKTRLYWMHLMPYFQTELLAHLENDLGAAIVAEEISHVWWDELDEAQPLRSLARKILSLYFNGPIVRRADQATRQIERYRCRGAVHFSHWGCRQSAGALHVLRGHLRKIGVPLLVLDGDCIDPENLQLGPLRTRVDAFMEMLA
jgi:benzoyl-CoA reductase/2-hydroxyglutaryl-CoA dehydratase subunit BcrC/BadD/HgdB